MKFFSADGKIWSRWSVKRNGEKNPVIDAVITSV
jgi:hypothetical protein